MFIKLPGVLKGVKYSIGTVLAKVTGVPKGVNRYTNQEDKKKLHPNFFWIKHACFQLMSGWMGGYKLSKKKKWVLFWSGRG